MIFSISVSALTSKCSRAWKWSDQSRLGLATYDIATESWDPLTHLGGNAFFVGRKSFRDSIRLLWSFAFTKISKQRGKAASAILFGRWETHNEVVLRGRETIGSTFIRWISRSVIQITCYKWPGTCAVDESRLNFQTEAGTYIGTCR